VDLPLGEEVRLVGLTSSVEAVRDDRGMWHVYAHDDADAARAQGFLMARDRMGQMEFIRRSATGRMAEYAGSLRPSLVDDDIDARFMGYARVGQEILDSVADEDRALIEAFSEGVTAHVEELRSGLLALPQGVQDVLPVELIDDWSPVDTMAIIRLETAALSYDAGDDVERTLAAADYAAAFPPDDPDPRIAARADGYHDFYPFAPARAVFVREGFPNQGTDSGTRALTAGPGRSEARQEALVARSALRRGARFLGHIGEGLDRLFGERPRGSNNWAVSGARTASGNPILASDPHLALTSPPLWWHVHINTRRAGGDMDAAGLSLAGSPGIALGFNEHLAWGETVSGFDVTDVYRESITPAADGSADTVLWNGEQVPIETVTEVIRTDSGREIELQLEVVPHHGVIIPDSRTGTEALSVRWTGGEPSFEPGAFLALMRATSIDEAREALDRFEVGGQNFVLASREGDIFWTTQIRLPVRDPRSLTYDPESRTGFTPCQVLPGTGEHEWTSDLSDRYLPHDLNPERGYVATANGDAVGVTADGDPHNDEHYIGCHFDHGYRIARIRERLDELVERGDVTREDVVELQSDAVSPLGRLLAPAVLAELDRAAGEVATAGTHGDLTAAIAEIGAERMGKVLEMRERLAAWTSFDTPAAVEGEPTASEIADSVATTIWNVAFGHLVRLAFSDELERCGHDPDDVVRTIQWALIEPDQLRTYDATAGDTRLWDDLGTEDVVETRGDRVVRAMGRALDWLEGQLGPDMDEWRWGRLHTLRLETLVPQLAGDVLSVPTPDDDAFPDGFPRHGDRYTVDVANFDPDEIEEFSYRNGPQQRFVAEMTPDGPVVLNALPGGESEDPDSAHHADEVELWRTNDPQPIWFREADVVAHAELRIRLLP
jgi:penicillin amidase